MVNLIGCEYKIVARRVVSVHKTVSFDRIDSRESKNSAVQSQESVDQRLQLGESFFSSGPAEREGRGG